MSEQMPDVSIQHAFEKDCLMLPISDLLPVRVLRPTIKASSKYQRIAASIAEVGLVEPPVVARTETSKFLILDGHVRIAILADLGRTEVDCLVSTDDEAFTYNRRISRLSAVQEHKMIVRAIERGVPENKIARALGMRVDGVQRRVKLLNGICGEAAGILRDKLCPMAVFETLRRMTPLRQIEAAELLVNANNFSTSYASAILAGTPQSQLVDPDRPKKIKGLSPEIMARMERELSRLQESITSIQDSYGREHLQLTVIRGYLTKLLGNPRVVRYLVASKPAFLEEFQAIADADSLIPLAEDIRSSRTEPEPIGDLV